MYPEISPERREALLEKYRNINVDDDYWAEYTIEQFIERAQAVGIAVHTKARQTRGGRTVVEPSVYWSLGYCQSDYASFEGSVEDWDKFLAYIGVRNETVIEYAREFFGVSWSAKDCGGVSLDVNRLGLAIDKDMQFPELMHTDDGEEGTFQRAIWLAKVDPYHGHDFENETRAAVEDLCKTLYSDLRAEYEYQTSDDAVLDTIFANDLHLGDSDE